MVAALVRLKVGEVRGHGGARIRPRGRGWRWAGRRTAWEKAIGPVRGTRGAVRGCEGGAGREGLGRWRGVLMEPHYSKKKAPGVGSRGRGANTRVCGASPLPCQA